MTRIARVLLKIVGALRRPGWWILAWTQRHTLGLWARSLKAEVSGAAHTDLRRMKLLTTSLLKVSTDARLTNSAGLRSLTLVGDEMVVETDQHWPQRDVLTGVLEGVDHVNGVRFAATMAQ